MSRNDVILGAVALVLVGFSLLVSLVLPRRRPDFPGNRLGLFTAVSVLLVVSMLAAVEVFGAEEPHETPGDIVTEAQDSGEPDAEGGGQPTTGETATGETGEMGGEPQGDAAAGEAIFAEQGCGNCHVLEAGGASGAVGPNLDEAKPSFEETVDQVTNGGDGMPAFGDQLSEEDIRNVSAYVVESTQG